MEAQEIAIRLGVAVLFGSLIGFERQWLQRMAGLRTNSLVAVGAAGFVVFSTMVSGDNSPTRMAAQVVSGVGFLGAGVILREGINVTGLNTAATLWCSAMVGTFAGAWADIQSKDEISLLIRCRYSQRRSGMHMAHVIRVRRVILHDDAHNPTNKLNVRGKAAERSENGGYAQLRVVKPLPEHLNLNDAGNYVSALMMVNAEIQKRLGKDRPEATIEDLRTNSSSAAERRMEAPSRPWSGPNMAICSSARSGSL
jgi:hypothetical protein